MTSFGDTHFHLPTSAGLVSLVRESPRWAAYLLDDRGLGTELAHGDNADETLGAALQALRGRA